MAGSLAEIADSFFTPAVNDLVPYEPGKPVEEVQRELGLERVVKLASNEGPFGPFPEAREAIERCAGELNRYPDGGAYRLRAALAERLDLRLEEVAPGAGSDGIVDCLSQAVLEPGDEIVCGWPSFPSYVIDARKLGAVPGPCRCADGRYDLDAMLDGDRPADEARLHLPSRTTRPARRTRAPSSTPTSSASPSTSLTVLDQAYFEYIDDPDYPDGIEEYLKAGRRVVVLRTFSKIYGLAGLRVGYGLAPAPIVTALAQGAPRLRHHDARAGGGAREPRLAGRARAPARRERRGPRPPRGDPARARPRSGRGRRSGTSSSSRSATTRGRSSSGCCARA